MHEPADEPLQDQGGDAAGAPGVHPLAPARVGDPLRYRPVQRRRRGVPLGPPEEGPLVLLQPHRGRPVPLGLGPSLRREVALPPIVPHPARPDASATEIPDPT